MIKLTKSRTWEAWAKQCRNLFLQYTNLTGIIYSWTTTKQLLETKSSQNSILKLPGSRSTTKERKQLNLPSYPHFPCLFQQSRRKKLMKSQSTSRKVMKPLRRSLTHRHPLNLNWSNQSHHQVLQWIR